MIHLGWDVWTLCDEFEACRFMRVSGFGFGGLDVALLFSVSTGTGVPPSLLSEKNFCRRSNRCISRKWLNVDCCVIFHCVQWLYVP